MVRISVLIISPVAATIISKLILKSVVYGDYGTSQDINVFDSMST